MKRALLFALSIGCGGESASSPPPVLPLPPEPRSEEPAPVAQESSDRDGDSIPDADDGCPDHAEQFNGRQDEDGCPDRAVCYFGDDAPPPPMITFEPGSVVIGDDDELLLRALQDELNGNLDIELVALLGVASRDEQRPSDVAAARAAVVRDELVRRGVDADRFVLYARVADAREVRPYMLQRAGVHAMPSELEGLTPLPR